jgi:hypothetical protein
MNPSVFLLKKRMMVLYCIFISFTCLAFSQTTLYPLQDAYVTQQLPSTNTNGYNLAVDFTYISPSWCRSVALLKFNLSQFNGMSITHAELRLSAGEEAIAGTSMLYAKYIESTWSASSVTWNTRPAVGGTIETNGSSGVIYPVFDVTSAVQAWVNGSHTNNGIWIEGSQNTSSPYSFGYYDIENGQSNTKPKLIIQATSQVSLITPNSGSFITGAYCSINWSSSSGVGAVRITLSLDGGVNYSYLIASYVSNHSYQWGITPNSTSPNLPNLMQHPQGQCRIKIEDINTGGGSDSSDQNFQILSPTPITINSPSQDMNLRVNYNYSVVWSSSCPLLNVDIYLSIDGGYSFDAITGLQNIPNTGSATWHTSMEEIKYSTIGISYSAYGGYYQSGTFMIVKPTLVINTTIYPTPTTSTSLVDYLNLTSVPYDSRSIAELYNGAVSTSDYSVTIITAQGMQYAPNGTFTNGNVIVCKDIMYSGSYINLPGYSTTTKFNVQTNYIEFNSNNATQYPLYAGSNIEFDSERLSEYLYDEGFVYLIDATIPPVGIAYNSAQILNYDSQGNEKKATISAVRAGTEMLFIMSLPLCSSLAGCIVPAAFGTIWAASTIMDMEDENVVTVNGVQCPDVNITVNFPERSISNGGTLDCQLDIFYNNTLQGYMYSPNGRNMIYYCNNPSTSITSTSGDIMYITSNGLYSHGIMSINATRIAEPIEYIIRNSNTSTGSYALIDLDDNNITYYGVIGQLYQYNFLDSGVFQSELNLYQTAGCSADTTYCSHPFNISINGKLSTFSVMPLVYPVSPAQAVSNMVLTVTAGIDTGEGGILQVSILGSDAPPEYRIMSSQTCSEREFVFLLHSPAPGQIPYQILLQFRPGVFTGPLITSYIGDIVLNLDYVVNWGNSGLTSPQSITIAVSSGLVSLTWGPVPGASYYKIYASNRPYVGYEYVGQSFIASFSTSLGNKKFYRVTALQ